MAVVTLIAAEATKQPDRVGYPRDYATTFESVRRTNVPQGKRVGTAYLNAPASRVKSLEQLPYPYGSVIVFEWFETEKDAAGNPITGRDGLWRTTKLARVDVMRREKGFGGAYGEDRAGEWEFASYQPDGSPMKLDGDGRACAKCHRGAAERDSVFRGRFPELPKK